MEVVLIPYYDHGGITIYHGDCREVLPEINCADLIVTDPPYVFGIASTFDEGKAGGWGDLMNSAGIYAGWLNEWARLLRNSDGAAWVFNSWRSFPVLARAAHEARWPITSLLVWDKEWIGPGGPAGLRPSYELVALFARPTFKIPNRSLPDIWRYQWSAHKPNGHPAEKPEGLLRQIISASCEGATTPRRVIDPFCGSGTTLVAAKHARQDAIGVEIEERWCEVAAKRLAQEVFGF